MVAGAGARLRGRERELFIDNLLVRIHLIIVDRTCAMGVLNSLFQVALHLPSLRGRLVGLGQDPEPVRCVTEQHSKPVPCARGG